MSYVITDKCLGERYAVCATVCPVECIHPIDHKGEQFMIIDPEVCIDCGVCIPECPVEAIVEQKDLRPDQAEYLALNAQLSAAWPLITQSREPLPDADDWAARGDKRALLSESA